MPFTARPPVRDPLVSTSTTTSALHRRHGVLLALGVSAFALVTATGCGGKQATDVGAAEQGSETDTDQGEEESGTPTTSEGDGDGDGNDTMGFVSIPDGGAINTCDPAAQDCPEGEKCTGYVVETGACCVDANRCVPVIGNGQLGDPCNRTSDNDDCALGLFCMTTSSGSTGEGVCLAFCDAVTQDCGDDGLPDAQCIAFNDGTLPLCQDDCDPIAQDCDPLLGCYGVGTQGFVCAIPGFESGAGNDGDTCFTVQSCKPGLGCTASEALDGCNAARCCTPYCDLSEPDPCSAPEQCVPYYEEGTAPPGYANVGLCAIPA